MTFATEIAKRRTKRATLVRMKPGRYVSETLSADGGGVYSMTFSYPIAAVKRNGTTLTETSTNPPSTNDNYYFDEATSTFKIKLAAAPSSTNVVIIYYYLFYTSGIDTEYYETPTDSATEMRYWKPALIPNSSFSESLEGLDAGVVSIPDATIELINLDHDFRNYLTDNDSFSNKDIDIWHEVNGQFRKAYTGSIKAIDSVSPSSVVISFSNQLSLLDKTAYMGDDFDECYHVSTTVPKKDLFKPIPLWIAEQTYYESKKAIVFNAVEYVEYATSAVCTNYNSAITTSNNREWTLCRSFSALSGGSQLKYQSFTTIQAATAVGSASQANFRLAPGYSGLYIGDSVKWTDAGTDYYGIIMYVGDFTYSSVTYNLCVRGVRNNTGTYVATPTATTSAVFTSFPCLTVICRQGEKLFFPCNEVEFYTTETLTAGGNYSLKITFYSNVEANSAFITADTFDPENMEVQYKLSIADTYIGHGNVLKAILDSAGVTTNSASFSAANSAPAQEISVSIPLKNESEYSPYLSYVQKILQSMLGYLKLNDSGEIEYHLLESPSPTDTRDDDQHMSEVTKSIEYRDVITDIVLKNQHEPVIPDDSITGGNVSSAKARYLHDTEKELVFEHVLKTASDGTISRLTEILALRSNRRSITTFRTETIDMATSVGDELTVESEGDSTDNFVRAIRKSENETTVECDDLLGL